MNNCNNPECNKELQDGMNYCNENCLRRHQEIKKRERTNAKVSAETTQPNVNPQTNQISENDPNEGTKSKTVLKNKALKLIATYGDNKTLKQYANLLCWDISVSFRTALEGYIEPMVEKGILLYVRENLYMVNPKFR